ncbi:SDR family NAD(P)-dependent oxidoreductase [Bacillus tianshenii]|nr:SDR family NAD(P)-dependent oxidoreductase [Bacillus tianshenii]
MNKVALVTGSNGGFGTALVEELLRQGYYVVATMRNLANQAAIQALARTLGKANAVHCMKLDVTDTADVHRLAEWLEQKGGVVDLLINNAGYCQGGIVEKLTEDEWKAQYDVNLFGVITVTKVLLPLLRGSEKARIVNISSVSGLLGLPAMSPYSSSKFALEGLSESLRLELLPFDISVSLIEPASYKTKIWDKGLANVQIAHGEYQEFLDKVYAEAVQSFQGGSDPQEIQQVIRRIIRSRKPKMRYQLGRDAIFLYWAKRLLPWSVIEWVVKRKLL